MYLKFKKYLFVLMMLFLVGCGGSDTATSSNTASQIVISHFGGVDFSANSSEAEWDDQDGYAVIWSPTYSYISGEENGGGLWYSNNVTDDTATYAYIQSLGNVDLASVTSIDNTAWHKYGDPLQSLQVGNVYVVKTRDGYAKFKVISTDSVSSDWSFKADYQYSTTTTF